MRAIFVLVMAVLSGCDEVDPQEYDGGEPDTESDTESESESVSESVACPDGEIVGDLCWLDDWATGVYSQGVNFCAERNAHIPTVYEWGDMVGGACYVPDEPAIGSCPECGDDCPGEWGDIWTSTAAYTESKRWVVNPDGRLVYATLDYPSTVITCVRQI